MNQPTLQRVAILGSTGSIGTNTLDVLARHAQRFEVFALTAATQVDLLQQQCLQFEPRYAVMASAAHAAQLAERLKGAGLRTEVLGGEAAIAEVAAHAEVDAVMAAIVGAAGLAPCLAAARAGKRLLPSGWTRLSSRRPAGRSARAIRGHCARSRRNRLARIRTGSWAARFRWTRPP